MKKLSIILILGICISFVVSAQADEDNYVYTWSTNIEEALEQAVAEELYVFIYFGGTDWCPFCMKFEEDVTDAPTFRRYLTNGFVPVLIDSPRYREISNEQRVYNEEQREKYSVSGFPSLLILNSEGETVAAMRYAQNGVNAFIREMKVAIRRFESDSVDETDSSEVETTTES